VAGIVMRATFVWRHAMQRRVLGARPLVTDRSAPPRSGTAGLPPGRGSPR
jgi:hypothetical protein